MRDNFEVEMRRFLRWSFALLLLAASSRPAFAGSKFTLRIWNNTTSPVEAMFPTFNTVLSGTLMGEQCFYGLEYFNNEEIKPQATLRGTVEFKNSGSCAFKVSKFALPILVYGYAGTNFTQIGVISRDSGGSVCSTIEASQVTPNPTGICLTRGSCSDEEVVFMIAPGSCPQ